MQISLINRILLVIAVLLTYYNYGASVVILNCYNIFEELDAAFVVAVFWLLPHIVIIVYFVSQVKLQKKKRTLLD